MRLDHIGAQSESDAVEAANNESSAGTVTVVTIRQAAAHMLP